MDYKNAFKETVILLCIMVFLASIPSSSVRLGHLGECYCLFADLFLVLLLKKSFVSKVNHSPDMAMKQPQ